MWAGYRRGFLHSFATSPTQGPPKVCPVTAVLCALSWILPNFLNLQSLSDTFSPLDIVDETSYDFIVVGGGTAGCVVASRLSENPDWKVLLLEAGGEEPILAGVPAFTPYNSETRLDWQFQTQPQENSCGGKPCMWTAGKVLGGTSVLGRMIYNRGSARSYDEWAQEGNDGWSFSELLPFLKMSEDNLDPSIAKDDKYHSQGGLQSVQRLPYQDINVQPLVEAFEELGYNSVDFNGPQQVGVMKPQFYQMDGTRKSSYNAFISPFRGIRKNLQVVTNVRATRILINDHKEIYGLEYAWDKFNLLSGRIFVDKEIIICAGAIKSPHLLMLSGIGPKDVLKKANINLVKDLPVGLNLRDHVTTTGINFKLNKDRVMSSNDGRVVENVYQYVGLHNGSFTGVGSLEVSACINSRYANDTDDYPDIQYFLPPQYGYKSEHGWELYKTPYSDYNEISFRPGVMKTKSTGYLSVHNEDPFANLLIYPNYFDNVEDLNILIDSCNFIVQNLSETESFKKMGMKLDTIPMPLCSHIDFGTDEYWVCIAKNYTQSLHHFSGTCKMGKPSDNSTVVDPELRVHGFRRLRVADASIMPTPVNGDPLAATQMIGEKAADMIKKTWTKR